jgi:hypothetical protein
MTQSVAQLVKKFRTSCDVWRFITIFKIAPPHFRQYCVVLAVLVRVYRLHHYVVYKLLLPTLLDGNAIIPLQLILTLGFRVSGGLLMFSFIKGWLRTSTDCFFRTTGYLRLTCFCRNPCLKADLVGPDTEHLVSPFICHRNELVT